MGMCPFSRMSRNGEDEYKMLMQKMKNLQEEISMVMSEREDENKAYQRDILAFTFKEAEWRKERKKLKDEVIKRVERKDNLCEVGDMMINDEDGEVGQCCIEKMRLERARRDEAIEKWKMLYLAIKDELDDLIQRTTYQGGGGLYCRLEEEEFMEEIEKEMNTKDEIIDELRARVASMEKEEYRRKREVDILRQSLRIMCNKRKMKKKHNLYEKAF